MKSIKSELKGKKETKPIRNKTSVLCERRAYLFMKYLNNGKQQHDTVTIGAVFKKK